jgi:hypothetical protein
MAERDQANDTELRLRSLLLLQRVFGYANNQSRAIFSKRSDVLILGSNFNRSVPIRAWTPTILRHKATRVPKLPQCSSDFVSCDNHLQRCFTLSLIYFSIWLKEKIVSLEQNANTRCRTNFPFLLLQVTKFGSGRVMRPVGVRCLSVDAVGPSQAQADHLEK